MRRTILASAAVAATLLLAGCAASGGSSSAPSGIVGPQQGPVMPDQMSKEGATADGSTGAVQADQRVITTGWITVIVDDPAAATDDAVALVEKLDGRIDSRTEQAGTESQKASSQLTIRVPADSVDQAIDGLKELGTVEQVSLSSSDVTLQVRDLDAQIKALQASVDRLLALVGQAATTADLVELETAISDRQGQLDSLKSQREYLGDQIDYSTITLDLQEKGALPSAAPGDFWSGLATGWAALLTALSGAVVVVGFLIPFLLPLAVIAVVVIVIVLLTRRAGRKPKLPTPPAQ